jgi:pyruvate/2-oxoglutarate dehydrogenase complex dihydrolipoamide acyltransferase (E2) component
MILAVDCAVELPVIEDGHIKPGWPLCVQTTIYVNLHISDGADAAQFMKSLAGFLKKTVRMLV